MYGIYANIGGILMVNVAIYGIHTDPMGNDSTLMLDMFTDADAEQLEDPRRQLPLGLSEILPAPAFSKPSPPRPEATRGTGAHLRVSGRILPAKKM